MRRIVVTFLFCVLAGPGALYAQDRVERTVTVSATSFVEREPDQAVVTFAVETFEPTANEAAQRNAQRMDALFGALRNLGIRDDQMRTTSYSIHPEYARPRPDQFEPGEQRIVGYRATNMVEVKVEPVDRVGGVIDAAIAAGANRVANLAFGLRDPRDARRAAIGEAVSDARAEAETLAAAIGEPLGPVLDITTGAVPPPRIPLPAARMDAMEMQAATPIEPGTLRVTATVTIVYRLGGQ